MQRMEVVAAQPNLTANLLGTRTADAARASTRKGQRQSPVNIVTGLSGNDERQLDGKADFELDVVPVKGMLDFSNSSHNITVKVPPGNTVAHENKQYELVELHFHSPSEHTLNGVHHDLELHLVHQAEDSSKLVFAVFFHADAREDEFLKALFKSRLPKQHHSHLETRNVDLPKLFCKDKEPIFTYAGSLTTPPYSEDVTWCVSSRVRPASASQLSRFRSSVPLDNNREIQKLKGRRVVRSVCAVKCNNESSSQPRSSVASMSADACCAIS